MGRKITAYLIFLTASVIGFGGAVFLRIKFGICPSAAPWDRLTDSGGDIFAALLCYWRFIRVPLAAFLAGFTVFSFPVAFASSIYLGAVCSWSVLCRVSDMSACVAVILFSALTLCANIIVCASAHNHASLLRVSVPPSVGILRSPFIARFTGHFLTVAFILLILSLIAFPLFTIIFR